MVVISRMDRKWIILIAILFIIFIGGMIYFGSTNEVPNSITPNRTETTISTSTSTISPTVTTTVPLNDTEAINQLLDTFHESIRTESLDNLMECFDEDSILEITGGAQKFKFTAKGQISDYFNHYFASEEGQIDYLVRSCSVTLEGSRANARCEIIQKGKFSTWNFELVKVQNTWKISSLNLFSFAQ